MVIVERYADRLLSLRLRILPRTRVSDEVAAALMSKSAGSSQELIDERRNVLGTVALLVALVGVVTAAANVGVVTAAARDRLGVEGLRDACLITFFTLAAAHLLMLVITVTSRRR